jgi:hypothetical protein
MRVVAVLGLMSVLAACGERRDHPDTPDAAPPPQVDANPNATVCGAMGKPETSVSGIVYAPNGTLPLYGINVYAAARDPGPFPDGAQCARCSDALPGDPIVQTISEPNGQFMLQGIPSGDDVRIVITSGKWRKQILLPHVEACVDHPLSAAQTTLPRDHTEGDLPKIAITTGFADSLECLVRKLGVADSEISTDQGPGRVHLYAGRGGKDQFKDGFPGGSGQMFSPATSLWGDLEKMKGYDIVMFSCEGAQYALDKPQAAMDAVKAYADYGGRLFASHWHNVWIEGSHGTDQQFQKPASWADAPGAPGIATWTDNEEELAINSSSLIDETSNPKGTAFATWMERVGGSTVRDQIVLQNQAPNEDDVVLSSGRTTCAAVDPAKAERWVYLPDQGKGTQNFQFTTPNEQPAEQRCGKVVFSDMHVSGIAGEGIYPDSCGTSNEMTPQEKALAFMFFDIASCVGILL